MSDIEDEPPPVLLPCTICSRTFRPEVLERHAKVCEKTSCKKRRVFDSFKSRVSGTELEEFLGPAPLPGQAPRRPCKSPVKKRQPSKWKETHENLIATLRAARGVEPLPDTIMEAPKPAGNEQCPSCNRYFGPRAFDRHVEFCKEKTARIKLTPSKVSQAQERLEARTKYRAPLSIKPKLTTKEKYSPMPSRKESSESCSVSSAKTSPPIPTLSRNSKAGKQNTGGFSRQSPIRSSERQRSVSPLKKPVTSSSKSSVKSEAQSRTTSQPKIKENLTSPEDLKPKTGSKASAQEKIRTSNGKQSQLKEEPGTQLKKMKKRTIEKKSSVPSDNESVDSETKDHRRGMSKHPQNRWNSAESISRSKRKDKGEKKESLMEEVEKINLDLTEAQKPLAKTGEVKSGRKSKQQNPQINDLSVNDESFGIFVAPCTVRPPSSSPSRTSLRTLKESPKKKVRGERKTSGKSEKIKTTQPPKRTAPDMDETSENKPEEDTAKPVSGPKTSRREKMSRIPKPKLDTSTKKPEQIIPEVVPETEPEPEPEVFATKCKDISPEKDSLEEKIKKNSKKWRNITEMSTQDLMQLSEDFQDETPELNESAIWEIAAEQFLNSDEPNQSTSAFSIDSLNENTDYIKSELIREKNSLNAEDDFIVLHAADPTKLVENDTDMKLSVSEPCFPYSRTIQKFKKTPENKQVDIIVFTAFPGAIQSKVTHRRRKKRKKAKKLTPLELSFIREKTFLANDIPKAKRRKISNKNSWATRLINFGDQFFSPSSKEETEERKRKFLEGLKGHREKIQKWQITANSHVRFLEEFQKSIEDDLKELKALAKGKKIKRRPGIKEFKKEKMKKLKEQGMNCSEGKDEKKTKGKSFEYFEINLEDVCDEMIEGKKTSVEEERIDQSESKKFDVANENPSKPKTVRHEQHLGKAKEEFCLPDYPQIMSHQNSSLENIEEVDENVEDEPAEKQIEIEDFILAKPNAKKILSKENNCLEELFPKPKKIAEVMAKSATTVQLGFTSDSVFDLKSNEKKKTLPQISGLGGPTRILQRRLKKESKLPKIWEKNSCEQKENSLLSLIEVWKNKKDVSQNEKSLKEKTTMPAGKLPPLMNKNSFQIAVLPGVLKKRLSEMFKERLVVGDYSNDSYDPFKQAERQMLALLSWPSTADIKTVKNLSPSSKSKSNSSHLETSPTSAFTKYPNKNEKTVKPTARKNLNETFALNANEKKNSVQEKPTYTAADDWEQIFEKHFDLNRNEMSEQMTRSVKSALDGLMKSTIKNKSIEEDLSPPKNKSEITQNSIITEVLYTSTPKQNTKSDKCSKQRSKNSDLNETPNTYRKHSNFTYGRITPPEDFNDSLGKLKKNDKVNRNSGISLSSLSFCSQISDTTLADEEVMRSNLEILGKAAAAAAARTPRRKYARSQSVFDERNKMLFAKTYDPNCSSSDENEAEVLPSKITEKQGKKSPSRNSNPKSSPSHFYRSQSVMDGRCKGDGDHSEEGDHVSSPESNRNRKAKLSGDSAYSSLNRRSPRENTQRNHQEDRLSSSGSEHSLPPPVDDYNLKPKSLDFDTSPLPKKDQPVKMSKFCHECGSKYPVAVAKFCCECGVRRLII